MLVLRGELSDFSSPCTPIWDTRVNQKADATNKDEKHITLLVLQLKI